MALIARSAGWVRLQGWRPRLCTALRTISFCPSALPNTAFAPPSGWLSSGAQDGCRQCAGYMLLHLGHCLGSAFQARIPRFTLIRVLLDISLLQHSPSNLSENCWVYLQNISSIQPPLTTAAVTTLLPAIGMSPGLLESVPNWPPCFCSCPQYSSPSGTLQTQVRPCHCSESSYGFPPHQVKANNL